MAYSDNKGLIKYFNGGYLLCKCEPYTGYEFDDSVFDEWYRDCVIGEFGTWSAAAEARERLNG